MSLHITSRKEQFSLAFIHAIASVAGFDTTIGRADDDSIDIGIRANRSFGAKRRAPRLDIQAKCTALDDRCGDTVVHDLPMKNYDDLRDPEVYVPRILVVVTVPEDVAEWLHESPAETAMRRCAFWTSLRGAPEVTNAEKRRVQIPRKQMFTVDALTAIMHRIGNGDHP